MRAILTFVLALTIQIASAQVVNVMTYNIRYATPADSVNEWSKRTAKVYALIRKYDPDIFGVQEAVHGQVIDLAKNLPGYDYVGVGRDDGKTKGEYSAIFYRKKKFKVTDHSTFWLSETPDVPGSKSWDAAITRVATWAKFKDLSSGKAIFMLNTHFDHIGKESRKNSAALLKRQVAALSDGLPVIVTGDFNCMREDAPYKEIMQEGGITLRDPAPQNPPGTFCSFKVNSITCRAIDYIFHTVQWTSSDYRVIEDNDGTYYPSDHLPVATTLSLKK